LKYVLIVLVGTVGSYLTNNFCAQSIGDVCLCSFRFQPMVFCPSKNDQFKRFQNLLVSTSGLLIEELLFNTKVSAIFEPLLGAMFKRDFEPSAPDPKGQNSLPGIFHLQLANSLIRDLLWHYAIMVYIVIFSNRPKIYSLPVF